ncbi:ABC-type polysaccharide/polyol phosphate export system, permease component [Pseudomonas alkylphenolica]|uniref:Transport permease protein n=2 Tax=Pseudomonas alkylphenolica TaxID=237609 RepID=A0A077FB76_9PSED|nr:ABC-type polysaccharide/polyol phosphate export system, permease component [Pseudomonas alkylphenolica]
MNTGFMLGIRSLTRNRGLIVQMTLRDISMRYKNSFLGGLWIVGQPLIQLMLYGFVFQVVLRSRWGLQTPDGQEVPFGLLLFCGILLHGLLADTMVRAPSLVVSNTSYVKRVIFPLEILPVITVGSTAVGIFIGFVILLAASLYYLGFHGLNILLLPIPIGLLVLLTLGVGWLLSAIGVFFRDLSQITSSLATIMLFTAPICYPAEMVPSEFRWLLNINPLTIPVETVRTLLFSNDPVQWASLGVYAAFALLAAAFGYFVFYRMRAGFADVL